MESQCGEGEGKGHSILFLSVSLDIAKECVESQCGEGEGISVL